MKVRKIFTGILIMAALLFIVAKSDLIAGVFGPIGDVIVAVAVAVLAAVFILLVVLPLLGFIFVGVGLIILFILLTLVLSLPFAAFKGHGPGISLFEASETRSLPSFERVIVAGDLNVLVVSGGGHAVALKGGADDLAAVKTVVKDGALVIQGGGNSGLRVAVSAGDLKGFTIDGAGEASLQRLKSLTFDLDMAGAAKVAAAGSCGKATFHLSGAGTLNAHDLQCDEVEIIVDGAGTARVSAAKRLKIKINGLGQVTYAGKPDNIERSISGLGRISPE
jgi:hypothetical protein